MKIISRAPFRLGLAGGGTDVRPYAFEIEGAVVNMAINKYCHVYITENAQTIFESIDLSLKEHHTGGNDHTLVLHKGVHEYFESLVGTDLTLHVVTHSEAPAGSGLGSSSTIVVALVKAYCELLSLHWSAFKLAEISIHIERDLLDLSGGMQDQFAAAFGGFNFLLFTQSGDSIVNKLPVSNSFAAQFESSSFLVSTNQSRESARIIDDHKDRAEKRDEDFLQKLLNLRSIAFSMQAGILQSDFDRFIQLMRDSWLIKKSTSSLITNQKITKLEADIECSGASAFKVSGAGGGGFCQVYCDPIKRNSVLEQLSNLGYQTERFSIEKKGAQSWKVV